LYSAKIIKLNKELCIISSLNDITETKQAKKEKLESEERLKFYMDNSPMAVVEWDSNFTVTRWTGGSEKIFGWKAEEVVGKQLMVLNITYEQDIPIVQKTGEKIKSGLFTQVFSCNRNYRKDRSIITCEWYNVILKDENGKMQSVLSKILDITERKQIELALKASEKEFRSLAESMPQIVWTTRADGWNTYFNQQWVDYTGLTLEESYGHGWNKPFHPDDQQRALDAWQNAVNNNAEYSIESRLRCHDGTYHWWLVRGVPQMDENGKILKWFGTCTDIEKIKNAEFELKKKFDEIESINKKLSVTNVELILAKEKAEIANNELSLQIEQKAKQAEELIIANKELEYQKEEKQKRADELVIVNKELEMFSYSVSHDLRAPLRHINGYVDLLLNRFYDSLPEKARHYLDTIADSSRQMGTLIDDLLQFSRIGRQEMRLADFDMNIVINEVLVPLKLDNQERNIEWRIATLPQVNGDQALLQLVWTNLLSNAVKFTSTRKKAIIEINVLDKNDVFIFSVHDNGVGFDMQYSHKLFGVFQRLHSTAEFEGTGIGLANVQHIILRHGGRTWAEAEPDKGATFYFSLPKNKEN
jgi:PAS domain S-box-containing protein